jgi:hypothetical protein
MKVVKDNQAHMFHELDHMIMEIKMRYWHFQIFTQEFTTKRLESITTSRLLLQLSDGLTVNSYDYASRGELNTPPDAGEAGHVEGEAAKCKVKGYLSSIEKLTLIDA